MPQVDVGGGGIEARLDQQRFVRLQRAGELFLEVLLADDLQRPLAEQVESVRRRRGNSSYLIRFIPTSMAFMFISTAPLGAQCLMCSTMWS